MKEIVGIITQCGSEPDIAYGEPKKNSTNIIYAFPSEYVDLYVEMFLKINGLKFRSLRNYASRVKVLRLAADSINDELEFRLIIAAIIKSMDENDWDLAKRLFSERVVTYRNLGQKRVERIQQHINVEILRGDVSVSISLKDLVKIVLK